MTEFHPDDFRRCDKLGRRKPHLIGTPIAWLLHVPGGLDRIRRVPGHAIADESDAEILVECPCGSRPVVPCADIANDLVKCSGCERWYIAHADRLLVVYGNMQLPGAQNAQAQGAVQD